MERAKILIVDDVVDNIQVAMNTLKEDGYDFSFARNGKEALKLTESTTFDLILLDIMMPEMNGFEVCERLKADPIRSDVPVVFLTARADTDSMKRGFEAGGVDYIAKPFHAEELLARVKTHVELHRAKKVLREHNLSLRTKMELAQKRMLSELEENQKEMIFVLAGLIESISDETGKHIHRVAEFSKRLAHYHPSLSEADAELLYYAAPMHDIGKIAIPHEILHKAGPLTDAEFEIMKTHTTAAYDYLKVSNRKYMHAAAIIAHEHHEQWSGGGYPRGLEGEEIHIFGRIVAIADVFDALTHKRVYKEAWPVEEAVRYIVENGGRMFDPTLVALFEKHIDEFVAIAKM